MMHQPVLDEEDGDELDEDDDVDLPSISALVLAV